jgi:phosphoserine phosphatase RsbU/P
MIAHPWLLALALGCLVAAILWGRSTARLQRAASRIEAETAGSATGRDAVDLAHSAWQKDLHATVLYALLAVGLFVASLYSAVWWSLPLLAVAVPVAASIRYAPRFLAEARLAEQRSQLERRAEEVLAQEELAPRRWAARLAPEDLPLIEGFEMGRVYEPGTGMMAGDFYDVYPTSGERLACVIGDVAGHGIEPSITAFQVKYLLRNFLRQYRDPAQALEELNVVLSTTGRPEDLVSVCSVVFDTSASTLRYASAGHPAAWLWQDGELRALRATGPLLTLDPAASFYSKELPLEPGDLLLMYTDGLAEARSGGQLFGEERIAGIIRRDPGQEPITDDVAILAVRRT